MREMKISKEKVSKISGVSERSIGYILAGERTPSIKTAESIAKAFGLEGWHLIMPGLKSDLIKNGTLNKLITNYSRSSGEGKKYIDRVAEQESKYGNEK